MSVSTANNIKEQLNTTLMSVLATTTNPNAKLHTEEEWRHWALFLLFLCLMLVIIIGNFLLIYCLLSIKGMKTVTGMFLVNMAIADCGTGIFSIPATSAAVLNRDIILKSQFCNFSGFFLVFFFVSSIETMTAISIQKYVTVGYNLQSRFTKKRAWLCIAGVWVTALLFAVGPTIGWSKYTYSKNGHQCAPIVTSSNKHYGILLLIFCFFMPITTIFYCYSKIYRFTKSHINCRRNRVCDDAELSDKMRKELASMESRMTFTLMIMVVAFFLCWTPVFTVIGLEVADISFHYSFEFVALLFAYSSSAVNPLLYASRHKEFRTSFKKIMNKILRRRTDDDSVPEICT